MNQYVHGYDTKENNRLEDQATTLVDYLHCDTKYIAGEKVLEAGCGVGAQTVTLAQNSPDAHFTSIDISHDSINEAKDKVSKLGIKNVTLEQGDIFNLKFKDEAFDHIFICFVLEHLSDPAKALSHLLKFLKPNGTITVIEGDHGSAFFYPDSEDARKAINTQVILQNKAGGNANIGRALYPILNSTALKEIQVSPRMIYVDGSKPELIEGFTKATFIAMIEGIREPAVKAGIIDQSTFDKGIHDLYKTANENGVFSYTFFKGIARK